MPGKLDKRRLILPTLFAILLGVISAVIVSIFNITPPLDFWIVAAGSTILVPCSLWYIFLAPLSKRDKSS